MSDKLSHEERNRRIDETIRRFEIPAPDRNTIETLAGRMKEVMEAPDLDDIRPAMTGRIEGLFNESSFKRIDMSLESAVEVLNEREHCFDEVNGGKWAIVAEQATLTENGAYYYTSKRLNEFEAIAIATFYVTHA